MPKIKVLGIRPLEEDNSKTKILGIEKMSPIKAEALRIYQDILKNKSFNGKRVSEVSIMEGRGIISGWSISVHRFPP